VFKPLSEHARADLVFEIGERLFRVQCKWGRLSLDRRTVAVRVAGARCVPAGYVRTTYSEGEVDLFAIYSGELDRCFLLPASLLAGRHTVQLRLAPARNGQRACTNLAEAFSFEGAIAQLGERCHGMAEVVGSSPTSSISTAAEGPATVGADGPVTVATDGPVTVGANRFRDEFGYWMDRVAAGEEVLITRHGRPRIRLSAAA
jgi:prevent-host-death family protein